MDRSLKELDYAWRPLAAPARLFERPGAQMVALFYDDPDTTPADQLRSDAAVVVAFRRRPDNVEGLLEILRSSGTTTILLADPASARRQPLAHEPRPRVAELLVRPHVRRRRVVARGDSLFRQTLG